MEEENKNGPYNSSEESLSESIFKQEDELEELHKIDWERSVRKAKNTLFVIGILILLSEVVSLFRSEEEIGVYIWIGIGIVSGTFITLGIFANRSKPYTAIRLGLIVFIAYLVGVAILHALAYGTEGIYKSLFSGILFKGIAIYMLGKALSDAKKLQRYYERSLTY